MIQRKKVLTIEATEADEMDLKEVKYTFTSESKA